MGFVANDLCGSITIFGCLFFRFFPTLNPVKKVCCNYVKYDENDELMAT
jgi:hypothetical protein